MKYTTREITDKSEWEKFVLSQNPQSFLQSWNWGETQRLVGNKVFRLGFCRKRELVGVCLAIKEQARRGPHLVVPGGPLVDFGNRALGRFALAALQALAKKENVWFVRVRPELADSAGSRNLFGRLGFVGAPMHLHAENTWVLGIDKPEEEILAGMRKTTRYLVRKSLAAGLVVEQSQDPTDAKILWQLQKETVARHRFVPFPEKLFRAQLETFGRDGQASLFLCKKGKEVLAAAIIIFYGDYAYYHHSASTSRYHDLPFSYFLQWQAILAARREGCKAYNFWGVAATDWPGHRFSGVTLFKTGFGGERIDWLHAQDLPTTPIYWLTYLFEIARRIVRRL